VLEGAPGEEIETVLKREIHETMQRHASSAGIFRKAAEISPGMGLIGTLIGLVQMLGNLNDPATIGPSMAVAVLTTFYGAVMATMVFAPIASKLERNAEGEVLVANIYMLAAASIARQENPRRLEGLLNALLPPEKRVRFYK
jgi:chemotaxis protein MotA